MTPADRVAARSEPMTEPCVLWTGARTSDGYGCLKDGRSRTASTSPGITESEGGRRDE